jgi:hypothetical protein
MHFAGSRYPETTKILFTLLVVDFVTLMKIRRLRSSSSPRAFKLRS